MPIEPGDATALTRASSASAFASGVADLDAILGRRRRTTASPLWQTAGLRQPGHEAVPLWLDAGVSSPEGAKQVLDLGAAYVIVGLETLRSPRRSRRFATRSATASPSASICATGTDCCRGRHRIGEPPHVIAARATSAGVGAIIVIDLARRTSAGLDLDLIRGAGAAAPGPMVIAGGGVRGPQDLARLADEGCDGALVASALLDGRIGVADVAAAQQFDQRFGYRRPSR